MWPALTRYRDDGRIEIVTEVAFQYRYHATNDCVGCERIVWDAQAHNWAFRNSTPGKVDRLFRAGQLLSSAAFSLGHGSNDAQKVMGIITLALVAGGIQAGGVGGKPPEVQLWVIIAAHTAIGLGTLQR